jgi:transcription elongation GreA/GreB family factor
MAARTLEGSVRHATNLSARPKRIATNRRPAHHPGLEKHDIIAKIIASLEIELEGYTRAARAAHAEATDEQCKAENKYDTRGLEASYLAQGQSRQADDIRQALQEYESMVPRQFTPREPIEQGAVVILERLEERSVYFVGPRAGGTEIEYEGQTVVVITPHSPMGQQLVGRKQGERVLLNIGGTRESIRVAAVF